MGRADYLALGDWNAVCYQCGFKRKASTLEKNWQGYYVCPEHNEPRQTQDFVRAIPDNQGVPWSQPMPAPVFIPRIITYTHQFIGAGDGVRTQYQLGSGLFPVTVDYLQISDIPPPFTAFTTNGTGLITTLFPLFDGAQVYAWGTETIS